MWLSYEYCSKSKWVNSGNSVGDLALSLGESIKKDRKRFKLVLDGSGDMWHLRIHYTVIDTYTDTELQGHCLLNKHAMCSDVIAYLRGSSDGVSFRDGFGIVSDDFMSTTGLELNGTQILTSYELKYLAQVYRDVCKPLMERKENIEEIRCNRINNKRRILRELEVKNAINKLKMGK